MRQTYDVGFDPVERCVESGKTSFWAGKDTVIVFLCPSFATLASQPAFSPGGPKDVYCPVVRENVFLGQSDPLVRYQSYDLVHQLAHLYLQGRGLTGETVPKEVTDWNGCVALGWAPYEGTPSVKNPFNLVYYAACECLFVLVHGDYGELMIGGSRQSGVRNDAGSICATVLRSD